MLSPSPARRGARLRQLPLFRDIGLSLGKSSLWIYLRVD